ncbi:MAG: MMPL family transporter [Streptosporangiales bacterium]|nr:MMPL family transporter [Streptosporangiales bacterium]
MLATATTPRVDLAGRITCLRSSEVTDSRERLPHCQTGYVRLAAVDDRVTTDRHGPLRAGAAGYRTRVLAALGRFCYRHHRWIAAAWLALVVVGFGLGSQVFDRLTDTEYAAPGSDSVRGSDLLADVADVGEQVVVLVDDHEVDDPQLRAAVQDAAAEVRDQRHVLSAVSWYDAPNPTMRAEDGRASLVLVEIDDDLTADEEDAAHHELDRRMRAIHDDVPGAEVRIGGQNAVFDDVSAQVEHDIRRGELIAFPATFVLLVVIFTGLVAAFMPLAGAIAAIAAGAARFQLRRRHRLQRHLHHHDHGPRPVHRLRVARGQPVSRGTRQRVARRERGQPHGRRRGPHRVLLRAHRRGRAERPAGVQDGDVPRLRHRGHQRDRGRRRRGAHPRPRPARPGRPLGAGPHQAAARRRLLLPGRAWHAAGRAARGRRRGRAAAARGHAVPRRQVRWRGRVHAAEERGEPAGGGGAGGPLPRR